MQQRKTSDFKRSIKALATEKNWLVETREGKGPTECLVIYMRDGAEVRRIASSVLRSDEKEIQPIVARQLVRKLQARIIGELPTVADETVRISVGILMDWIKSWF